MSTCANCWIFDGADCFIWSFFLFSVGSDCCHPPPWYSNFKRAEPLPELKYSKYSGWFPASIYLRRWSGGYCYLKFFEMELLNTWMDGFQLRNDSEGGVKFHRPLFPTPWSEGREVRIRVLAIAQSINAMVSFQNHDGFLNQHTLWWTNIAIENGHL